MATTFPALDQPLPEGGIRTINFFNGRLLTGSDMGREQEARREADSRIGLALGDGVAEGLEVAFAGRIAPGNRPAATISAGVAINRDGRTLRLTRDTTVALSRSVAQFSDAIPCLFDDCPGLSEGDYVAGQGLYLLTIAPAFVSEGRARTSGFEEGGARCNTDATVEAVQFRLVEIESALFPEASFAATDFRNRVAYRAFGEGVTRFWPADLLGSKPRGDDLLTALGSRLRRSEVPLALLAFTGSFDHLFTDVWSVRRPIEVRDPNSVIANLTERRREGVGWAMFRQFQSQIDSLAGPNGALAPATARGHFRWLPPAGILPWLDDADAAAFFAGMTVRGPHYIDAASVEPLIRESFVMPAIETDSPETVWLYRIAQTAFAESGRVMVFANGHLPYRGDARFDLNYWDFANYSLTGV
ncbi:MAG TPA: hypothetical protein VMN38_01995 [Sphingomicrobium sp.]|nr:hypothetical protein [Sphingomicrobium sp.]